MSKAVRILPHYTYGDYENWEGRWELIDGIPWAMSPLPVPQHQRIASNLGGEFYIQLKNCETCAVYQPLDYLVSDDTVLQPDVLIVGGRTIKNYLDFPPSLVVEILSPATALKDRHSKYSIYESEKIPYYLIISPDTEEVEIYELENNAYALKQKGKDFQYQFSLDNCQATINFKEIW
jgi:Uma2 family endonuclease